MSKQIIVIIPDSFNVKNTILRIKSELNSDTVVVSEVNTIRSQVADVSLLIQELQIKLGTLNK
jgi:hypothetical protein